MLRVQVDGKRRDFGLGGVDLNRKWDAVDDRSASSGRSLLTLKEARVKAAEGRRLAKAGKDPSIEWRRISEEIPTFETAARTYYESVKDGWRNAKHAAQWLSTLEAYAFPKIGRKRVDEVDATAMHAVLAPIWYEKSETARRVRQRMGSVLDYAKAKDWRSTEAPMRALAAMFGRRQAKGGNFPAMPYADLPGLMASLSAGDTVGRAAVRFAILTAARSGEVRGATWDEIDLEAKVWTVPAKRMKGGAEHSVPLSDAALEILQTMSGMIRGQKGELVFKGRSGKPLSDMTLAKAFKVAGGETFTVHGTARSSFRDWVAEQTSFPDAWAEAALAHTLPNKVEAAYRRTKFLDQRRGLMEAWADYIGGKSNVVQLAARA